MIPLHIIIALLSPSIDIWSSVAFGAIRNLSCIFDREDSVFYKGFPEVDIEKAMAAI